MFPKWHTGEHSGIKVNKSGEVITIQVRVPFLLQVHQIGEAWFRRVGADNLVNIVCVICHKHMVSWWGVVVLHRCPLSEKACSYITFIQILFDFVQLLIKHGKLLLSVCMLLFLHLKMIVTLYYLRRDYYVGISYFEWQCSLVIHINYQSFKILKEILSQIALEITFQIAARIVKTTLWFEL